METQALKYIKKLMDSGIIPRYFLVRASKNGCTSLEMTEMLAEEKFGKEAIETLKSPLLTKKHKK